MFWSGLTLLTAVTHTYTELLIRHTLVGIGEATFVTIAPTFVADLFAERMRGRILGVFYLAIPVGSAAGYLLGGYLAPQSWMAISVLCRGRSRISARARGVVSEGTGTRASLIPSKETPERGTILGLARNPAFLTSTLGMAAMTFSLGGIQVWMPKFLLQRARLHAGGGEFAFGIIIVVDGILAALAGGWLGDYLLPRIEEFVLSGFGGKHVAGCPGDDRGAVREGQLMIPAIGVAAFFLLLNTAPLNAAVINSVGAHIRAMALAVNIFIIHLLGDVPSPTMMGWVADRRSLQAAFILPVIAMGISSAILFYGMRFAPAVAVDGQKAFTPRTRRARRKTRSTPNVFIFIGLREPFWRWHGFPALWMLLLACPAWPMFPGRSGIGIRCCPAGNPRVSIIVPARNEEETIEQALQTLLALDYDNYEVIAVNDRSTDPTGEIMERIAESAGKIPTRVAEIATRVGHPASCG